MSLDQRILDLARETYEQIERIRLLGRYVGEDTQEQETTAIALAISTYGMETCRQTFDRAIALIATTEGKPS